MIPVSYHIPKFGDSDACYSKFINDKYKNKLFTSLEPPKSGSKILPYIGIAELQSVNIINNNLGFTEIKAIKSQSTGHIYGVDRLIRDAIYGQVRFGYLLNPIHKFEKPTFDMVANENFAIKIISKV